MIGHELTALHGLTHGATLAIVLPVYVHSLIIGVVSWVVVPVYEFRFYSLAIAFSHLVIDVIKTYSPKGLWNFVIDQVAHLAILIICLLYTSSYILPMNAFLQFIDTLTQICEICSYYIFFHYLLRFEVL